MGTVRESAIKAIASLVPKGSREAIDWVSPRRPNKTEDQQLTLR